jgi:hypothetical protein
MKLLKFQIGISLIIPVLYFMKWVDPNISGLSKNTGVGMDLIILQNNVTGFNPDFGYLLTFPLSGKLFFIITVISFFMILFRNFTIKMISNLNKPISISIILLNITSIIYPIYFIYWLNKSLNQMKNLNEISKEYFPKETSDFISPLSINYIVYTIIFISIINLLIELKLNIYDKNNG